MNERSRSDKRRSKRKTLWFVTIFAVLLIIVGGYEWINRDEKQTNASPPKQETAAEKKVAPKEKAVEPSAKEEPATNPEPDATDEEEAEPVTEEPEPVTPELTDVEKYPEAVESAYIIGENMNAIYVAADELQGRFTPYVKDGDFRTFEFAGKDELKDLFLYDTNLSIQVTSSAHFEAPDYTQDDFRKTREAHLIIIKELEQLETLLEVYRGKFRQDPEGTLAQAKGHFERIKTAAQTDLPGFEKFIESAKAKKDPKLSNNSNVVSEENGELIMEFLDGQFQLTNMLKEADEEYYNMSLEYPVKGNAMTAGDALSLMVNGMSDKITGIQKSSTADSEIKSIAIALSPKIIEMQSVVASLVSSEKWLKDDDMSMRQTGYYQGQEAIQKLMELNNEMDTSDFAQLDLPTPDIDGV